MESGSACPSVPHETLMSLSLLKISAPFLYRYYLYIRI